MFVASRSADSRDSLSPDGVREGIEYSSRASSVGIAAYPGPQPATASSPAAASSHGPIMSPRTPTTRQEASSLDKAAGERRQGSPRDEAAAAQAAGAVSTEASGSARVGGQGFRFDKMSKANADFVNALEDSEDDDDEFSAAVAAARRSR